MGATRACSGADSGRTRADEEEASAKSATLAIPVIRTILLDVRLRITRAEVKGRALGLVMCSRERKRGTSLEGVLLL